MNALAARTGDPISIVQKWGRYHYDLTSHLGSVELFLREHAGLVEVAVANERLSWLKGMERCHRCCLKASLGFGESVVLPFESGADSKEHWLQSDCNWPFYVAMGKILSVIDMAFGEVERWLLTTTPHLKDIRIACPESPTGYEHGVVLGWPVWEIRRTFQKFLRVLDDSTGEDLYDLAELLRGT
jgi:hypothetical protein